MDDVDRDVLYRTRPDSEDEEHMLEVTVNTRNVEGNQNHNSGTRNIVCTVIHHIKIITIIHSKNTIIMIVVVTTIIIIFLRVHRQIFLQEEASSKNVPHKEKGPP